RSLPRHTLPPHPPTARVLSSRPPPPPPPPLFPYTTLFRSAPTRGRSPPGGRSQRTCSPVTPPLWRRTTTCSGGRSGEGASAASGDRKSTRLNSSHVSISYAVFCSKKKTNSPGEGTSSSRNE